LEVEDWKSCRRDRRVKKNRREKKLAHLGAKADCNFLIASKKRSEVEMPGKEGSSAGDSEKMRLRGKTKR